MVDDDLKNRWIQNVYIGLSSNHEVGQPLQRNHTMKRSCYLQPTQLFIIAHEGDSEVADLAQTVHGYVGKHYNTFERWQHNDMLLGFFSQMTTVTLYISQANHSLTLPPSVSSHKEPHAPKHKEHKTPFMRQRGWWGWWAKYYDIVQMGQHIELPVCGTGEDLMPQSKTNYII